MLDDVTGALQLEQGVGYLSRVNGIVRHFEEYVYSSKVSMRKSVSFVREI